jgi:hypothetical protein
MNPALKNVISIIREMTVANAPGESGGYTGQSSTPETTGGFDPLQGFAMTRFGTVDRRNKTYKKKYDQWLRSLGLLKSK